MPMKMMTSTKPTPSAMARRGWHRRRVPADAALLHHGERRGQGTGAQQPDRSVADAAVKRPLIWPRPPVIGRDHRGADHLVIEHDGEAVADIGAADIGEPAGADLSNVKLTTHSPVCGFARRGRR